MSTERRDAVTVVTLDRPERRNAVTIELCEELHRTLLDVAASDARAVVLRGAGDHFSVGADLDGPHSDAGTLERLGPVYHAATLLHTMPQVTIAAVHGGCAGAAMGWACACDFRFASTGARFNTAFLRVGVSGDMGLVWSLSRLVGGARARELLFFPEKIGAGEALRHDLVTRVFEPDALHADVLAIAHRLAAHDSFPLRMMKANVVSAETSAMAEYVEIESARHLHVIADSARGGFANATGRSHAR
ncbi:enoyl-CoA hydratase/isomerase family protein [Actinomadura sp. CNU-125]|uniref:enoyl-CoA hydratase/isomerase family protein n=1 Tax=Actinomadura sp. CNU-125 TaxID=1904961 RepID=UPI0021CC644C|nr:enoyl-CoA hydratase/isomerase family protein [Actinomadura sp. CNU-125]